MHINLILETEQRSASPVTFKSLLKIAGGTVIVMLILWLVSVYSAYHELQANVKQAENEWMITEPKYIAAQQLRTELAQKNTKFKEIQSWKTTQIDWGYQLDRLQTITPSMIQLTELHISQDILVTSNNMPARVFTLRLAGKTNAERSEINVGEYQQALFKQPPFNDFVETVNIPAGAFRQDPMTKTDRVFEIVCKYNPRPFE